MDATTVDDAIRFIAEFEKNTIDQMSPHNPFKKEFLHVKEEFYKRLAAYEDSGDYLTFEDLQGLTELQAFMQRLHELIKLH